MRRLLSFVLLASALSHASAQGGPGVAGPPQALADTATARAVLVTLARWISDSASSGMPQGRFVMTGDSLPRCINGCPDLTRELRRSLAGDFERSIKLKPVVGDGRVVVTVSYPAIGADSVTWVSLQIGRAVCDTRDRVKLGSYWVRLRRESGADWRVIESRATAGIYTGCRIIPPG